VFGVNEPPSSSGLKMRRRLVSSRKDGKPGGLNPSTSWPSTGASTWRWSRGSPGGSAPITQLGTPPASGPQQDTPALLAEQVDLLLDATADPKPWLGAWAVLAAANGARNGELCGLEWSDLDLEVGTVRCRQELAIVDADLLPGGSTASAGRRKELAVGPVKPKASKAILNLPPFAVQELREHRRQQARLRLASAPPSPCDGSSRGSHPARCS
jgi:integrase